jgi:hemoglobin
VKKDIVNRADIELLVNTFYRKILADKQLGYIFDKVAKVNWTAHLEIMYNFWENIILFTGDYEGNPMTLHKHLHQIKSLNENHFNQWNRLFINTVDELFKGPNATMAKHRTLNISNIIRKSIIEYRGEKK